MSRIPGPGDHGRDAAEPPPYPDRSPAAGPAFPGPRPPRRGAGYRLIMVVGVLAAVVLAGGAGTLAFQEIREVVAAQQAGPALPVTDGQPLDEALQRAHEGVRVDWAAGPYPDEAGLDQGREVTEAPGVLMVNTRFITGTSAAIGTGSGIVLTTEGLAITNYHVVENASDVTVTVADTGESYLASVLGRDSLHDIAVLQIENAPDLTTSSIDTAVPELGEDSAAIGNGLGQGYLTAVTGEVTGLGESIVASASEPDDYARLSGLIETSADVVPGYSGGPLVDADGQVVGITTAASQGQSAQEVDGYAIPVATALDVVAQVLSGQETDTVSIGVDGALGIVVATEDGAAVVKEVAEDSSAERLGLRIGDTVRSVNGEAVHSAAQVSTIVNDQNVGDIVVVEWTTQDGQDRSGEVALQEAVVY